jgi:chromatin segregation and condensation protein Rec8/ScpA/Scc1 (kleisin family)
MVERSFVVRKVKGSSLFNRPEKEPDGEEPRKKEQGSKIDRWSEEKKPEKDREWMKSTKRSKERLDSKKGKKKENVESEKTGSVERILENYEKRKGGQENMEISSSKREMVYRKNLDEIDSSMGKIWSKCGNLSNGGNLWRMETKRSNQNERSGWNLEMFCKVDDKKNSLV